MTIGRLRRLLLTAAALPVSIASLAACGDDDTAGAGPTAQSGTPRQSGDDDVSAERCVVRLHGRSERGAATAVNGGVAEIAPSGNAEYGQGREWRYASDDEFGAARSTVADAIAAVGCRRVALDGFSNGAAFAAKLYCSGETFGDTLVGVVVDDPVPDTAVLDCAPADGVDVALYWSGGLTEAAAGASCDELGWTCEGDELLGIDAYAKALGVEVQASPFDEHRWYRDAPELAAWLAG